MNHRTSSTFIIPLAFALTTWAATVEGQVVTDNFATNHDYSGGNVAGTIWTGILNASNLAQGNANLTNPGRLTWSSTANSGWENANFTNAPTLYGTVGGDFDTSVQVTSMTTSRFSDGGLIVRAPADGGGEDYLALRYFAPFGFNSVRNTVDGVTINQNLTGLQSFLRMTRTGNTFYFYTKANVTDPWSLRNTLIRADLGGVTDLQVGLWFGTFSSAAGSVQFDNFRLQGAIIGSVPEPGATTLLVATTVACVLLWKRNRKAA